jgi:hypothetical protein
VQGLLAGGAAGHDLEFGEDAGDTFEPVLHPVEDHLAAQRRVVFAQGPVEKLELDLADGVARGLGAGGVGAQPAIAGEGEAGGDAGLVHHHTLDLRDQRVHLGQREVAAGADIDDALLGLGLDEEIDAEVVLAVIGEDLEDDEDHGADGDEGHHRVADDERDHPAEERAAVPGLDLLRRAGA